VALRTKSKAGAMEQKVQKVHCNIILIALLLS